MTFDIFTYAFLLHSEPFRRLTGARSKTVENSYDHGLPLQHLDESRCNESCFVNTPRPTLIIPGLSSISALRLSSFRVMIKNLSARGASSPRKGPCPPTEQH